MKFKKALAGIIAAAAVMNLSVPITAQEENYNINIDITKSGYYDYTIGKYVYADGTVAEPPKNQKPGSDEQNDDVCAAELPKAYDSRTTFEERGLIFPEIRNQNPTGSCWAHAAIASMEIRGLLNGFFTNSMNVNFAEVMTTASSGGLILAL